MKATIFSKKNIVLFLICIFINTQFVISQSNEQNLEKYWHYRYRLTNYFMVVGEGAGKSLPADIRNQYNVGELSFNETPVSLGYYIGVLSTEYYLLRKNNQPTDQTLTELYYALKAVERLDLNAEIEWGNTCCTSNTERNGFMLMDDVPADFIKANSDNYSLENSKLNFSINNPYPNSNYTTPSSGQPGFVYATHSSFAEFTTQTYSQKHAPSKDMLFNLAMGLALCKHFVTDNPWAVDDSYIHFHNTITDLDVDYNFNYFARSEGDQIVLYMKNSPFGTHALWILQYANNTHIPDQHGGDARLMAYGIAKMGTFFTGGDYTNAVSVLNEGAWHLAQSPQSRIFPSSAQLALPVAAIGNSWKRTTSQVITLPIPFINWGHYELQNWQWVWVDTEIIYEIPLPSLISVNSTKEGIQFQGDYDEDVLGPWPSSHYGLDLFYGGINRLLWGSKWWDHPQLDLCRMQSILNTAPDDGPYNHIGGDFTLGAYDWACSRRFYNSSPQPTFGKADFYGNYNGLDYMLLHNLYYCLQESATALVPQKIMPDNEIFGAGPFSSPGVYYYVGAPYEFTNTRNEILMEYTRLHWGYGVNGAAIITGGSEGVTLGNHVEVLEGAELTVLTTEECGSVSQAAYVFNPSYYRKLIKNNETQNYDTLPQNKTIPEPVFLESLNLVVSPNPNNGTFKISITKNNKPIGIKELKVIDMMGKVIWQTGASANNVFDVDITKYSQGIYYVRSINEQGEIEVQKLVKQ